MTAVSVGDDGVLNAEVKEWLAPAWLDRDLGWLDFNERVLEEALDERTPLLERVKFLAIFASNLDEFFMKRVAALREAPLTPERETLLKNLREKLVPMLEAQARCFREELIPQLADNHVQLRRWPELTEAQRAEAREFFETQISPALTPLVIDSAENFPFLSNLSMSLVFALDDEESKERMYARVKVPSGLRQWVQLRADAGPQEFIFVRLHEVIEANLHQLYRGMKVGRPTRMRLTRDAEVQTPEETEASQLEQVKRLVRKRRYEPVVRLEFAAGAEAGVTELLRLQFGLRAEDLYEVADEVDFTSLFELAGLNLPLLKDEPWTPLTPPALREGTDIFSVIRTGDVMVHHPYESFDASVEHFIEAAASDPQTVAVKMTVYRVGDDTPFVKALIKAAEAGKQVACVIELHARFDEERNLHWAAALAKAGAHVTFGVKGLKIHGKTALVVRKEQDGLRAYAHIGTGNYHVRTARLYADVGLLTADQLITRDVVALFHYLTGHSKGPEFRALLVAPLTMRSGMLRLIAREAELARGGKPGRIVAKMNQLEDPEMIEALCEASRAGVTVDLIVRGFCCLKPGVHGVSENIRVRSIIGRFLEHARIFYFGSGAELPLDGEFYIGSADWMERNLSKRIEVVTPVLAPGPRQRLWNILQTNLQDARQAWTLDSTGMYARPASSEDALGTHATLMHTATKAATA